MIRSRRFLMRWYMVALGAGLLLAPAALRADDQKNDKDKPAGEPTRAQRAASLQEFESAFNDFVKAYMAAKTPAEQRASMSKRPDQARLTKLIADAQKVIDENPKDDVAAGALAFLVQFGPEEKREAAVKLLGEHHLKS